MKFWMVLALVAVCGSARADSLNVPFDFSRTAIGLNVEIWQTPLYMILDTGVDPSVIDLKRAQSLHLKIDHDAGGEASGEGDAEHAVVFPTTIEGLSIKGRSFPAIDALAADMSGLSSHYRRTLDGVLGYSFLSDKIVLIDYAKTTLSILDRPADATASIAVCRKRWSAELKSFKDDTIPAIRDFRFGEASGPISLDTGSNGGISLYQDALNLPGLRSALPKKGETTYAGARGEAKTDTYALNEPVGFGPFVLPPGQVVTLKPNHGSGDERVANIGNKLFAAMKLKMLLDYKNRLMTFYGDCS